MRARGGVSRTSYDVTPSQQLSLLNRRFTVHKQVVNIATALTLDEALDAARLEAALRLTILRWDAFGLRFTRRFGRVRQHFAERETLGITHIDFRGRKPAAMERTFLAEAARRIPLFRSPQARFVLFRTPEGHSGVFSVISHLIMDSWSISTFYVDLISVYAALDAGTALPPPPADYEPLLAEELAYQTSSRSRADKAFWQDELSQPQPRFVSLRGSSVLDRYRARTRRPDAGEANIIHLRTRADHVVTRVPADDVARLEAFVGRERTGSLPLLFHLALRLYLAKVNGRPSDITMGMVLARRATLAEKNSGGSRVQQFRFRAVLPPEFTFVEALALLAERQTRYFRHLDYSSLDTLFMTHQLHGTRPGTERFDVNFTFQPLAMDVGHGYRCSTRWYCNGATSMPAYLTIMDDDASGGLRCIWERNVRHMPASAIEACHAFMLAALRAGVERPSITLGELMDLG